LKVHTELEYNKVKNLMTSKNRTELTKLCKLIKEINKCVCAPG